MYRRILKFIGFIAAVIAVSSVVNPFLAYRMSRYDPVDFGKYYEYSGVIGVHTSYSDGTRSYDEVEKMCDSEDLHFAITTDVNTVKPLERSLSRRFGMTLMIPAVEISADKGGDRFLVIGDSIPILPGDNVSVDSALSYAHRKGSLIVLDRSRNLRRANENFGRLAGLVNGMELYNFNEDWKNLFSLTQINKVIGGYLTYPVNGHSLTYLIRYPEKRIDEYNRLNESHRMVGIGAAGAGSNDILGWRRDYYFASYESVLRTVHTVIVTTELYSGKYWHDRQITLDAIRKGHVYISFPALEPARGFFFTASSGNSRAMMGDSLKLDSIARLRISLPDSNDVMTRVLRNGTIIKSYDDAGSVSFSVSTPGQYMVEVFQKRLTLPLFLSRAYPWILSNPIYIYKMEGG